MNDLEEIFAVADAVPEPVLGQMAEAIRASAEKHPAGATCSCPAIDALRVLMRTHDIRPKG